LLQKGRRSCLFTVVIASVPFSILGIRNLLLDVRETVHANQFWHNYVYLHWSKRRRWKVHDNGIPSFCYCYVKKFTFTHDL